MGPLELALLLLQRLALVGVEVVLLQVLGEHHLRLLAGLQSALGIGLVHAQRLVDHHRLLKGPVRLRPALPGVGDLLLQELQPLDHLRDGLLAVLVEPVLLVGLLPLRGQLGDLGQIHLGLVHVLAGQLVGVGAVPGLQADQHGVEGRAPGDLVVGLGALLLLLDVGLLAAGAGEVGVGLQPLDLQGAGAHLGLGLLELGEALEAGEALQGALAVSGDGGEVLDAGAHRGGRLQGGGLVDVEGEAAGEVLLQGAEGDLGDLRPGVQLGDAGLVQGGGVGQQVGQPIGLLDRVPAVGAEDEVGLAACVQSLNHARPPGLELQDRGVIQGDLLWDRERFTAPRPSKRKAAPKGARKSAPPRPSAARSRLKSRHPGPGQRGHRLLRAGGGRAPGG